MWPESAVPLRPHHGMCLAYFEGQGYSEGFTAHMQSMLEALTEGRGDESPVPVRLTVRADAICSACPRNRLGICDCEEKVRRFDRDVLSLCGLTEGEVLPFGPFVRRVQDRILTPGRRDDICGGCQWENLCARKRSRWETGTPPLSDMQRSIE